MPVDKFEEYRLFIEDTARLTERRQQVTNTYIAVHSALLGLLTFLAERTWTGPWIQTVLLFPLIAAGIAASRYWLALIETYRTLIDFRFEQLEAMERSEALQGVHGMYTKEAERFFRHAPPQQRLGFSRIEKQLPRLFLGLYVLYGVAALAWLALRALLLLVRLIL